jgi:hypothetical protein
MDWTHCGTESDPAPSMAVPRERKNMGGKYESSPEVGRVFNRIAAHRFPLRECQTAAWTAVRTTQRGWGLQRDIQIVLAHFHPELATEAA